MLEELERLEEIILIDKFELVIKARAIMARLSRNETPDWLVALANFNIQENSLMDLLNNIRPLIISEKMEINDDDDDDEEFLE